MSDPTPTTTSVPAPIKRRILNRQVMEWAMWDWGSAAFNAVVTTFVFTRYLTTDGLFTTKEVAEFNLSIGMTIAGFVIAALAPITGQRADRQGKGSTWLAIFTGLVVACMAGMFFVHPNSPMGPMVALWFGITLLGLGNIFFEFASVNYNAMLNHIARKEDMGRISGIGWGMGYVGGIVLLLIILVGFIDPVVQWAGASTQNNFNVRAAMILAAAWFAAFALPVILRPPATKVAAEVSKRGGADTRSTPLAGHESLWESYRLLWGTVKVLAKEAPHTLYFLIASAVFRDGMAAVFTFGAIIAGSVFGITSGQVIIFGVVANVVAGLATFAFGVVDDKIGPKAVIIISLVSMCISAIGIFVLHNQGAWVFWSLGLILSLFVGPVQSASRSLLARVIPEGREGEIFGLYATTGRAVSFMAPALYTLALWVGDLVTPGTGDHSHWGILGIVFVLGTGLLLTLRVRVEEAHLSNVGS